MGAITTTNSGDALDGFLTKVGAARTSLIQAINSSEPLRAAFAEAEAKLILLEDITPEVAAYLLRFCDPKLDMVEVVNTNDKDAKVRAVAMAILNGFVPGREQFGVHTGKLYVKEAGYRKLFSKIAGCSTPDVQVGHPDLADLGNGRKVWKVDGVATVTWNGVEYGVECVRDYAIGIPSHGTDHIDGIKTKARRRLLQLLWKKVSSIGLDDSEDEFTTGHSASVHVVEPSKQIEAPVTRPAETSNPTEAPKSTEGQMNDITWSHDWRTEAKRIGHTDGDPHQAITMAREMRLATTVQRLEEILDRAKKACGADKKDISTRLVQKLEHYARYRVEKLMEPQG